MCDPIGTLLVVAVSQSHDPSAWQLSNHKTIQERLYRLWRAQKERERERDVVRQRERERWGGREGEIEGLTPEEGSLFPSGLGLTGKPL